MLETLDMGHMADAEGDFKCLQHNVLYLFLSVETYSLSLKFEPVQRDMLKVDDNWWECTWVIRIHENWCKLDIQIEQDLQLLSIFLLVSFHSDPWGWNPFQKYCSTYMY